MSSPIIRFAYFVSAWAGIVVMLNCSIVHQEEALVPRIVNGRPAGNGEFPWAMALMSRRHKEHVICAFSLISTQTAIGAAHCILSRKVSALEGRIGHILLSLAQRVYFKEKLPYPSYTRKPATQYYDIGLLILQEPVVLTEHIQTIPLPLKSWKYEGSAWVAGWGTLSNDSLETTEELRTTRVNLLLCKCPDLPEKLKPNIICAGNLGKGPGKFDSGTALVKHEGATKILIGVHIGGSLGASIMGQPSFYTSTAMFHKWIEGSSEGNVTFIDPSAM